jgi:hypothetical protein
VCIECYAFEYVVIYDLNRKLGFTA